jgi:hypothetical protein
MVSEVGIERNFFNLIKNLQDNYTDIVLDGKKFRVPIKIQHKARCPPSSVLFNTVIEVLDSLIRKETKYIHVGKQEIKLVFKHVHV